MALQKTNNILFEVREACKLLSLQPPLGVFDSQDETAILMGSAANLAGIMVNDAHDWQSQSRSLEFLGDGILKSFPLPADFDRVVDHTGWSMASRNPVSVVDAQTWSAIQAQLVTVTLSPVCRILEDQMQFATAPATGEKIVFEYVISNWVKDADDPATLKQYSDKNGDVPVFDWLMMTLAIRAKWLALKSMDNSDAMNDFNERVRQLTQNQVMAPVLSLNGGSNVGMRYLDGFHNAPETGFGH